MVVSSSFKLHGRMVKLLLESWVVILKRRAVEIVLQGTIVKIALQSRVEKVVL